MNRFRRAYRKQLKAQEKVELVHQSCFYDLAGDMNLKTGRCAQRVTSTKTLYTTLHRLISILIQFVKHRRHHPEPTALVGTVGITAR